MKIENFEIKFHPKEARLTSVVDVSDLPVTIAREARKDFGYRFIGNWINSRFLSGDAVIFQHKSALLEDC